MAKSLSPLEVYNLLPKTNCGKCGEKNCLSFATRLVNLEVEVERCTPLVEEAQYKENYVKLKNLLKPPVKEVLIVRGDRVVRIGGEYVMYRHELTYRRPTAIAIDVSDDMSRELIAERVKQVEEFSYPYIGKQLKLDLIAVRSVTGDPARFSEVVKTVLDNTSLPLVLCSLDPEVLKAGLAEMSGDKPLLYAATKDNWRRMAELALAYDCPLVVSAPNDPTTLKSLVKTMLECGLEDLVLDPGTMGGEGLPDTLVNFTMIRKAVFRAGDELLGFPLLGAPIAVWLGGGRALDKKWEECYLAGMLIVRYADILIMHSLDGWVLLPLVMLRDNIYTDPRKPVSVEPGLYKIGQPDETSPVMFTTNFALTYYTVSSDIQSAKIDSYLLVVDTEGLSVESAVAGRKLTADRVAEALKESGVEKLVKHRYLIIPGRASRLSGEIEEATGWTVLVGPLDSSGIPKFLDEKWYKPKLWEGGAQPK